MDWRVPIDQQSPVAPSASERNAEPIISFIDSDEYRRAAGDPKLITLAIRARALRESLLHERRSP
jgi:hypothetical protein